MKPVVKELEASQLKQELPDFRPGDTVRVALRIREGDKERIQNVEGLCIRRKGEGLRETFTVRRVSYGVGMERIFPLHSPRIESIKVIRRGKVRRAKLYYQRALRGKKARITERRMEYEKGHHAREKAAELAKKEAEEAEKKAAEEKAKREAEEAEKKAAEEKAAAEETATEEAEEKSGE